LITGASPASSFSCSTSSRYCAATTSLPAEPGEARHDGLAAAELQRIDHVIVEGVRHHYGQRVVVLVEDQCLVLFQEQPELVRQAFGDVFFRDEAEFHEDGADPLPVFLFALQTQRTVDVGGFEFSTVNEQSAQGRLLFLAYGS
jgi:hypothetical protein